MHPHKRNLIVAGSFMILLVTAITFILIYYFSTPKFGDTFDGLRAYTDVETQVAFGPRIPGSEAHRQTIDWIQKKLAEAGWDSEIRESTWGGQTATNIYASRGDFLPIIIIGAHYDSRIFADHDPDPLKHTQPVPGANDGASGVAVLLELARVLPKDSVPIGLVFFDIEDNGNIEGWDWILGSRAFAAEMLEAPEAVIVVDMIGDADLRIYQEQMSNLQLRQTIWATAATLGHDDVFIPEARYSILDDHVPFLERGIPAVDIIDINYDYWHTTLDTPDKVSAQSLQTVGETLLTWLKEYPVTSP